MLNHWRVRPLLRRARLAEVGQESVDAVAGAAVALDPAVPAAFGGVVGEGLLDFTSGSQPRRVLGCRDELRAGQVEVALARAFGGKAKAAAEFEFGLEEVGLEPAVD
ncbi:hypothetical protein [Streptomyces sp. NPDC056682]|uniref:hypothetical protein n=1 Tax=Streptomyces sp. NPDC056682 TaxID=3345909 RepID=UPI0036ABA7E8